MSSVLQTTGSSQYVEPDAYIDYQMEKTRTGVKSTDMLTATVGSVTLLLGYLLAFVILDHWVIPGGFGVVARVVLLTGVVAACGTWLAIGVVIPYLRRVNSLYAARLIEESNPDLRSTLLTLVDLDEAGRTISEPVRQTLEKRAAVALSHTDVDHAIDRRLLMRIMYVLLGIVAIGCLYTILTPKKITTSIYRALVPMSQAAVATQTEIIEVKPGDVEVLARSQVEVVVDLRGLAPERVTLLYSTADRNPNTAGARLLLTDEPGASLAAIREKVASGDIKAVISWRENLLGKAGFSAEHLGKLRHLVVAHVTMNDAAGLAHVVLPTAAWSEKRGSMINATGRLQRLNKAVEPPSQARDDWEVLRDLTQALTGSNGIYLVEDLFKVMAAEIPEFSGLTLAKIGPEGVALLPSDETVPLLTREADRKAKGVIVG